MTKTYDITANFRDVTNKSKCRKSYSINASNWRKLQESNLYFPVKKSYHVIVNRAYNLNQCVDRYQSLPIVIVTNVWIVIIQVQEKN